MMSSYMVAFIVVVLIVLSSALSAHYEYNLSFDAVIMYFLIAVTIAFVCAMIIAILAACIVKLQRMLSPASAAPSESIPPELTLSPAQMTVISVLQHLAQRQNDEPVKTLPTYNKALLLSKPVRIDPELENQSPPSYTPIVMPPPYYANNDGLANLPNYSEGPSIYPGMPPAYSIKE